MFNSGGNSYIGPMAVAVYQSKSSSRVVGKKQNGVLCITCDFAFLKRTPLKEFAQENCARTSILPQVVVSHRSHSCDRSTFSEYVRVCVEVKVFDIASKVVITKLAFFDRASVAFLRLPSATVFPACRLEHYCRSVRRRRRLRWINPRAASVCLSVSNVYLYRGGKTVTPAALAAVAATIKESCFMDGRPEPYCRRQAGKHCVRRTSATAAIWAGSRL